MSCMLTPNYFIPKPIRLLKTASSSSTTTIITCCSNNCYSSLTFHQRYEHSKAKQGRLHCSPLQSHSFPKNQKICFRQTTALERLKKKGSDPVQILKEDGDWTNLQFWAAIRFLRKTSRFKEVLEVFDFWKNMDRSRVNYENYRRLIELLVDVGLVEAAASVLGDMKIHGLKPSREVYNLMVLVYAQKGRLDYAMSFLKEMEESGLTPDTETYDPLIQAYADHRMYDEMDQCLKDMESKGCLPDHITYNLLIREFALAGLVRKMESTHHKLLSKKMHLQSSTLFAMVEAYANFGMLDKMERLLNKVLNSKTCLKEDLIRRIARVYIENHMFSRLDDLGIHLSSKAGSTDLVWCLRMLSHACLLSKKGLYSVIHEMESNEIPWNVTIANIISLTYLKMRDFKHLNLLLSELPSRYVKPDIVTMSVLFDACIAGFDGNAVKSTWGRMGFFEEDVEMFTDSLVLTSFGKGQFFRSIEEIYSSLKHDNVKEKTSTYHDIINLVVHHYQA